MYAAFVGKSRDPVYNCSSISGQRGALGGKVFLMVSVTQVFVFAGLISNYRRKQRRCGFPDWLIINYLKDCSGFVSYVGFY